MRATKVTFRIERSLYIVERSPQRITPMLSESNCPSLLSSVYFLTLDVRPNVLVGLKLVAGLTSLRNALPLQMTSVHTPIYIPQYSIADLFVTNTLRRAYPFKIMTICDEDLHPI